MKKTKKIVMMGIVAVALVSTSATVLAATNYSTPTEAVAGVTGKSADEVLALRKSGLGCGAIAAEVGKLAEFQQEARNIYQAKLDAQVAAKALEQEQADAKMATMEQRQAICDGTGTGNVNAGAGNAGAGNGNKGAGKGNGAQDGSGNSGGGMKRGKGAQDGSCVSQ